MKRHPNVTMVWAHFMGNGRGVRPYPEHWKYLDQMLGDPAYRHVFIDIAWGPVIAPAILDTPEHVRMTADLMRKYPDRFLFGSDQSASSDWQLVRKSYDAWTPLWNELGPELTAEDRAGQLRQDFRPVAQDIALGGEEPGADPVKAPSRRKRRRGAGSGSRLRLLVDAEKVAARVAKVRGDLGRVDTDGLHDLAALRDDRLH